jgi:hypothetical protein
MKLHLQDYTRHLQNTEGLSNTNTASIAFEGNTSRKTERLFVLCDGCLWSATILDKQHSYAAVCLQCGKQLSSLPLTNDEGYRLSFDQRRGIDVEFFRR